MSELNQSVSNTWPQLTRNGFYFHKHLRRDSNPLILLGEKIVSSCNIPNSWPQLAKCQTKMFKVYAQNGSKPIPLSLYKGLTHRRLSPALRQVCHHVIREKRETAQSPRINDHFTPLCTDLSSIYPPFMS